MGEEEGLDLGERMTEGGRRVRRIERLRGLAARIQKVARDYQRVAPMIAKRGERVLEALSTKGVARASAETFSVVSEEAERVMKNILGAKKNRES